MQQPPEIRSWMVSYLSELLGIAPDDVDVTASFQDYGIDSTAMAAMTADLIRYIGRKLPTACLYEFRSIDQAITDIEAASLAQTGG